MTQSNIIQYAKFEALRRYDQAEGRKLRLQAAGLPTKNAEDQMAKYEKEYDELTILQYQAEQEEKAETA